MKIKLKCDKNNRLGFVEKYTQYFYEDRQISVLGMANVGNYFSEPYVFRGEEFIPAAQIEDEIGIEKYVRAKKPFYSVIGTGNIIVSAKISMSLDKPSIYIPEKSMFNLYYLDKDSIVQKSNTEWEAKLRRLSATNESLEKWFKSLGEKFVESGNDRELFLKSRFIK